MERAPALFTETSRCVSKYFAPEGWYRPSRRTNNICLFVLPGIEIFSNLTFWICLLALFFRRKTLFWERGSRAEKASGFGWRLVVFSRLGPFNNPIRGQRVKTSVFFWKEKSSSPRRSTFRQCQVMIRLKTFLQEKRNQLKKRRPKVILTKKSADQIMWQEPPTPL